MKAVCIFLAEGFEEMEAMFPLDIMRRGGLNVKTVSVTGNKTVISSHQVPIVADLLFEELKEEDVEMIVLPGGLPGATNLDAHAGLDKLIMSFAAAGKPLAAICAAPMVYGKRGLLKGKKATCYPGFDKFLEGAEYTGNMVEVVDNFILGKGPGAAPAFGFTILEKFAGAEKALEVKKGMLLAELYRLFTVRRLMTGIFLVAIIAVISVSDLISIDSINWPAELKQSICDQLQITNTLL